MKLSISTLGCPGWDFETVLRNFENLGADIEVRGIDGEMEADRITRFSEDRAEETRELLKKHGLRLTDFGTSCKFHDPAAREENLRQARSAMDVCARMGIPAIRVFGNDIPDPDNAQRSIDSLCEGLKSACAYGQEKGVEVWLEIHGNFNTVETMEKVAKAMQNVPGFGIIWDVAHSDRGCNGAYEEFYQVIRPFVRHVHLKDHVRRDGKFVLCGIGKGEIPIEGIIRLLEADGYQGYYSFEWEKAWVPELEEPETAFPEYIRYMKNL